MEVIREKGAASARVNQEKTKEGRLHFQWCACWPTNQREKAMRTAFPGSHLEPAHHVLALWDYCGKEESRVAGPVSFGVPPVARNVAGSKRDRNAMLLEKGAEQAVWDGDVGLGQYLNLKLNIAAFKIANAPKFEHAKPIGYWLYGAAGTGKSRYARTNWASFYVKDVHTHWFCGYAGEEAVILDDVDMSCKKDVFFQRLKIWADVYQIPA